MSVRLASEESLNYGKRAIPDVPSTPTIGTATDSYNGGALVTFTPGVLGGAATTYTVTSSPGGLTGVGASSPVEIDGLTPGTSYTFTVTASNSTGSSAASSSSSSFIPGPKQNFVSIATGVVGSGGGSITFSNIPQTYSHLQIRFTGRSLYSAGTDIIIYRFNSDSGNNYTLHRFYGDGSSPGAQGAIPQTYALAGDMPAATSSSSLTTGVAVIDLLDYSNTSKYKTARAFAGRDENGLGYVWFSSNLWLNTAAITSINIFGGNGNLTQYSQAALYGIK